MLFSLFLSFLLPIYVAGACDLPTLNVDGFSWAENLVFDGLGGLFVSDAVKGELSKIELCVDPNGVSTYCSNVYLKDGLRSLGGLSVTADGKTLYAGASLDDKTAVIISTPTSNNPDGTYEIVAKPTTKPNGLAFDESNGIFYYTTEGSVTDPGKVVAVNLKTGTETVVQPDVKGADGAWLDVASGLLFVGELFTKKIWVLNVTVPDAVVPLGHYVGLGDALGHKDMLDDITLMSPGQVASPIEDTVLLGCDWTGKSIKSFKLNGGDVTSLPLPAGVDSIYQPTSVRWGKGPGFCPNSVYFTEGGGVTKKQTSRRVLQIQMKEE